MFSASIRLSRCLLTYLQILFKIKRTSCYFKSLKSSFGDVKNKFGCFGCPAKILFVADIHLLLLTEWCDGVRICILGFRLLFSFEQNLSESNVVICKSIWCCILSRLLQWLHLGSENSLKTMTKLIFHFWYFWTRFDVISSSMFLVFHFQNVIVSQVHSNCLLNNAVNGNFCQI